MDCPCQRRQCACRDCAVCKNKRCRCCADSALAVLPPDDLVHAHNAHMTALAHLELALAALSGSTTEKLSWTDWAKQKVKAAHEAVKAGAATLKKSKAAGAVLYKIVKPIANTAVGRAIANSRGVKSIASAITAGSKEHTTATAEHDAHDKEFERRRQEEKVLAAQAAAQQAAQQEEDKTERRSTKSKTSPPKIGPHGYEIGDI
jgi:hypothetical protein